MSETEVQTKYYYISSEKNFKKVNRLHHSVILIPSVIEHTFPVEQRLILIPPVMYKYQILYVKNCRATASLYPLNSYGLFLRRLELNLKSENRACCCWLSC